jgi:hypothetical protein
MFIIATGMVINLLLITALLVGLFHRFEIPKHKAAFGYIVTASMLIYILLLSSIAIYRLIVTHDIYSLILLLCALSPFITGKFATYNTLKAYTIIQILCCLCSLIILSILL